MIKCITIRHFFRRYPVDEDNHVFEGKIGTLSCYCLCIYYLL